MLLFTLLACPVTETLPCAEGGSGTLQVALNLPTESWETIPALDVYDGDGAFVARVEEGASLELPAGLYTLAARRGTVDSGGRMGRAFGLLDQTVQQVCVVDGDAAEWAGTWELQPSSEKLWVLSGEAAYGFDDDLTGTAVDPALTIQVDLSNDLRGLAVDPMGNLWIATSPTYDSRLLVYPPGGVDGSVTPLELGRELFVNGEQIVALTFDDKDQLWVLMRNTNAGTPEIWAFSPERALGFLGTGLLPTAPSQRIIVEGMVAPDAMAVGPDDRLWIADFGGDQVLSVGVGAGVYADPLTVAPEQAFAGGWEDETGTHALGGPTGLGFDGDGRLWVNYWTNPVLARFDVPATGESLRAPDLLVDGSVLDLPAGLVLDRDGGVWYGNEPQDGAGELVSCDVDTGAERSRARSADALAPTTLVFDPR